MEGHSHGIARSPLASGATTAGPAIVSPPCVAPSDATDPAKSKTDGADDPTIPEFGAKKKKKKKKLLKPRLGFDDLYEYTEKTLGEGAHAVVSEIRSRSTGEYFAVKEIRKYSCGDAELIRKQVMDEWALLNACRMENEEPHPNILHMKEFHEDDESYKMVFEILEGGELLQHIYDRTSFTEREAADVTRDIATALNHIHAKGIAHRDLKPQNILCASTKRASPAKLADFNLSYLPSDGSNSPVIFSDPVGTPDYMSPEVIRQQQGEDITYSKSCDIWGLGVTVYIMLSGEAPFDAGDCGSPSCKWREGEHCSRCLENLQDAITDGVLDFGGPVWSTISGAAKDLIGRMLVKEEDRISAKEILQHPWVKQKAPQTPLATPDVLAKMARGVDFFKIFATNASNFERALEAPTSRRSGPSSFLPLHTTESVLIKRREQRRKSLAAVPSAISSFSTVAQLDVHAIGTPTLRRPAEHL